MATAKQKLPNFIILGEQKCGTGWLRDMLVTHPDVFMALNEVKFFSHKANYSRGIAHYAKVFAKAKQGIIGEKSPEYFWQHSGQAELNQDIFGLIDEALPEVKVVVVLRDPVARAFSALQHHVEHRGRRIHPNLLKRHTLDQLLFSGKFDLSHLGILERGYYANRIESAMSIFGDRLTVLVFERDIVANPRAGLQKICDHIGAPRWNGFEYSRNDKAAKPSFPAIWASYYLPYLRPLIRAADIFEPMKLTPTPELRKKVADVYRPDVTRLESLLGLKLNGEWWLK